MSNREIKMGTRVWEAALVCANKGVAHPRTGIVTVGEVAREAGVSAPTARKYMRLAAGQGACNSYRVQYPQEIFVFDTE